MIQHIILVLEGGGAKGPTQIAEISVIEDQLKTLMSDMVDAVVTTSIGSVEASFCLIGDKPIIEFWKILEPNMKQIFSPEHWWSLPRYKFKNYVDLYEKYLGNNVKFGDAKTKLVTTTVGMTDGKNHFYKSWHEKDKNFKITDIVCKSFAAPFFFGGIIDKVEKEVFLDGGTGFCNLPLIEAYCEAVANGWLAEGHSTHILALGAGSQDYTLSFKQCSKGNVIFKTIREVKRFFTSATGGLARLQSVMYQVNTIDYLTKFLPNLSCQYTNWDKMPKKLDKIDNWKARNIYFNKGLELGKSIDVQPFINKLKNVNK